MGCGWIQLVQQLVQQASCRAWPSHAEMGLSGSWALRGQTLRRQTLRRHDSHESLGRVIGGEFDPGSGSTLAACLMHASRARALSGVLRGGRVRNTWATCPGVGDSRGKPRVIPHTLRLQSGGARKTLRRRLRRGLRPISWTVGSRPTVAMIGSWSERTASHTGTETRPRLLREAAARNLPQWGQP